VERGRVISRSPRPAESVKVSFEPGLVESLLDEVVSKPGSLPLLQLLREMWGRQENVLICSEMRL
jgi:hypothetical protein